MSYDSDDYSDNYSDGGLFGGDGSDWGDDGVSHHHDGSDDEDGPDHNDKTGDGISVVIDDGSDPCSHEYGVNNRYVPLGYGLIPAPPPVQPPRDEKTVVYWENKITGDYIRETITEKTTADRDQRYETITVGNKNTGESSTRQDRETLVFDGGNGSPAAAPESALSINTGGSGFPGYNKSS